MGIYICYNDIFMDTFRLYTLEHSLEWDGIKWAMEKQIRRLYYMKMATEYVYRL